MVLTVNYLLNNVVERKGQLTQTPKAPGSVPLNVLAAGVQLFCLTDEQTFQETANVLQH